MKPYIVLLLGCIFLAGCDPLGLGKATGDGKKSLVTTPVSIKDNFDQLKTVVENMDIGFDTLKYISTSTIAGIYIQDFTLWKSTNPIVKVEVLPNNNKSLVKVDINNYPAFPKDAYITQNKTTYDNDQRVSQDTITIIPQKKQSNFILLIWNVFITITAIVLLIILLKKKRKNNA